MLLRKLQSELEFSDEAKNFEEVPRDGVQGAELKQDKSLLIMIKFSPP